MLLTQLQLDTKGNIMDIFLLLPSCGWCVNHVLSYFNSSFLSFSIFLVVILILILIFLGLLL